MKRLYRCALAALFAFAVPGVAKADGNMALFETVEYRLPSHDQLPKWRQVLEGIEQERSVYETCATSSSACPSRRVMAWQATLKSSHGISPRKQIRNINRYVNNWRYREDARNWGTSDYWATPLEFISRSGDCEDYAIMKYVSLRALGFSADSMRMIVVHDEVRNIAHAVLAVAVEDEVLILDNLTDAILGQQQIRHYRPYYSVNEAGLWTHHTANELLVESSRH